MCEIAVTKQPPDQEMENKSPRHIQVEDVTVWKQIVLVHKQCGILKQGSIVFHPPPGRVYAFQKQQYRQGDEHQNQSGCGYFPTSGGVHFSLSD
jgi:hypothetical protein